MIEMNVLMALLGFFYKKFSDAAFLYKLKYVHL